MYRPIKVRYPENHTFFQDADLLYAKTIKNSSIGFYDTLIGKNQLKKNKLNRNFLVVLTVVYILYQWKNI